MNGHHETNGINWVQVLIELLLLSVLIVFIFHGCFESAKEREFARCSTCLSQLRQIAIAAQMYDQDNAGYYPDLHWTGKLATYLGNNAAMFHCPLDKSSGKKISYGYSGLLFRADGSGVNESVMNAPAEIGVICDAGPSRLYPNGGLVDGGGLQPVLSMAVTPIPRHNGSIIMGYTDGHVTCCQNGYNPHDISNPVTRAFDMAGALGYIDNPAGGISDFSVGATSQDSVTVGGEPCTRAILLAAAGAWKVKAKAAIAQDEFHGQYAIQQRGANYLWGIGDGVQPAGHAVPIARDLVVVIIAMDSKISFASPQQKENGPVSVWDIAAVRKAFALGAKKDVIQAYTYGKDSGTRRFFATHLDAHGKPLQFGPKTITVKDDFAMVKKVAGDPYGIGYCSSTAADTVREEPGYGDFPSTTNPNGVQVIGLRTPDGKVHIFPQDNPKSRWVMPANPPDWPLSRTLYAECGGNAWRSDGTGIANVMLTPGAPGRKALQAGPLFKASFWTP